jgi:4-azaleucine resistance transporter AzlC
MQAAQALRRMQGTQAWRDVLAGIKRVTPVILGFVPVGFAYGVLAAKAGLSDFNVMLMSMVVYAGSAQLASVALFAAGAPALAVIAATFVINLRHLLMSAALAPRMTGWPAWRVGLMGFELTDETFALHITRYAQDTPYPRAEFFAVNHTAHLSWITGSALGLMASGLLGDVRPLGLDFVLPAMFIALLVMQVRRRTHILVAAAALVASSVFLALDFSHWGVLLATILAATLGTGADKWNRT